MSHITSVQAADQQFQQSRPLWTPARAAGDDIGYANQVDVDEREHDAVLTFWRNGPKAQRQRVAQITIPLSVLALLRKAKAK